MCTVTFIPLGKAAIFTSNRDEHASRGNALPPKVYAVNQVKNIFPKDTKAGGTWFISNENGDVGILLNGAFKKHDPAPPYRKSRGQMLLDVFDTGSPYDRLRGYDFTGIENFTLVLWQESVLWEIRWDGTKLKLRKIDSDLPHIWSSVTLYTPSMIEERHRWFRNWLYGRKKITQRDIFNFHFHAEHGNREYGLRIARDNQISTTSITSLYLSSQQANLRHYDLVRDMEYILEYDLNQLKQQAIFSRQAYEMDREN